MPRPKGSENKVTREVKKALSDALAGEIEQLPEHLAELTPAERIEALSKLLNYVVPKLKETNNEATIKTSGELPPWMNQQ